MNRTDLRRLINSAFAADRPDYARTLAQTWLKLVPGDLGLRFDLARAYAAENNQEDALQTLTLLTTVDLENTAAYQLLAAVAGEQPDGLYAAATFHTLTGWPVPSTSTAPDWMAPARQAVIALSTDHIESAREQVNLALQADQTSPFLSWLLLQTHWRAKEIDLALPLAKGFHDRWPKSLAFSLCLIEGLFRTGNAPQAVELLHTVSALDSAGEVVARYWGEQHPYRDLWPHLPDFNLPAPIPAAIIALLGLNRLPAAQAGAAKSEILVEEKYQPLPKQPRPVKSVHHAKTGSASGVGSASAAKSRLEQDHQAAATPKLPGVEPLPEPTPSARYGHSAKIVSEELRDIESTLSTIAAQIGSTRAGRKPVHVVLFSPKLLTAKFGPEGAEQVLKLIGELGKVTAKRRNRTVVLLAPEAPTEGYNLKAVDPTKAWDVKMMLHDLDGRLAAKQFAITSLLIVGGDDLLPFHRLPNPTDDADEDVPSDNPYGTLDENYFVPEWPVGRLPSPCGRDPEPLCKMIRATITAHQNRGTTVRWMPAFLFNFLQRWIRAAPIKSLGYSASVWKDASVEVFAPIGSAANLQTCPPLDSEKAPAVAKTQFSYFNLHGVEDGPNWYGQRTEADGYGPLYPVAFAPKDAAGESLPNVVFTEACYGANILNKVEPDAALCLRFLTDGANTFVGSTRIAYGSVAAPLIGADMLGRLFWENLLGGDSVGEALSRAKLNLAQAMHKRQSFLDGEDQKTLISFLLYGDPLLTVSVPGAKGRLGGRKKDLPAALKTIAMEYEAGDESEAQPETVAEIKALLAHYLPGSESARVSLSRPLSPIGAKSKSAPTHRVYTFSKNIPTTTKQSIPAYARVTVNKAGKVVKIAVSR